MGFTELLDTGDAKEMERTLVNASMGIKLVAMLGLQLELEALFHILRPEIRGLTVDGITRPLNSGSCIFGQTYQSTMPRLNYNKFPKKKILLDD